MRLSSNSKQRTRAKLNWSSSGSSPASPSSRRLRRLASPRPPPRRTGRTHAVGSEWRSTAYPPTGPDRLKKSVTGLPTFLALSSRRASPPGHGVPMTGSQPDNEAIFHTARDISNPERRREYVRDACGRDEARIAHVEALLAAADTRDSLQGRPAVSSAVPTSDQPTTGLGTVIGPYKLVEH